MMEYFHELATVVIEIDFGEGMQRYSKMDSCNIEHISFKTIYFQLLPSC